MILKNDRHEIVIETDLGWIFHFKPDAIDKLQKVPKYDNYPTLVDIVNNSEEVLTLLNSIDGPAVHHKSGLTEKEEYWISGKKCEEGAEQWKAMIYDPQFNKDFEKQILDDND